MSSSGQKNLLNWAKKNTGGYPGVWVEDFSKSFRDGLAFCALVHTYKHSLIPWKTLKTDTEEDQLRNHKLAFDTAEKEWGVNKLLDPEDMLVGSEPDKLSVMTYLAEMYKHMKGEIAEGNPYEGDYLFQLAERQKKKREEEKQQSSDQPVRSKQVEVNKMNFNSSDSVDVSNIKGCGQCQKTNHYPMCPGFTPETFRKTRCQHCFHSTDEHLGFVSDEEKQELERVEREKQEDLKKLVERAKRKKQVKEEKKKQLREKKLQELNSNRKGKLEKELERLKEEHSKKLEDRKLLLKQRQKLEDERQEKYMEARRSKRVKQREYDRKLSTMSEEERKNLEQELNELTQIEEETKDPYVYDELEPIEEPPSDISQITLEENEEIEVDSDEIEFSDEELQDPMLDEIPIQVETPKTVTKQPVKKVPIKKIPPKKDPVKKDVVKKELVKKDVPKKEPERQFISSNTSSNDEIVDSGDRSERRYLRYQRRIKILDENHIIESITSMVYKIQSY